MNTTYPKIALLFGIFALVFYVALIASREHLHNEPLLLFVLYCGGCYVVATLIANRIVQNGHDVKEECAYSKEQKDNVGKIKNCCYSAAATVLIIGNIYCSITSNNLYRNGLQHLDNGRYIDAVKDFVDSYNYDRIVMSRGHSTDERALVMEGYAQMRTGDFEAALTTLGRLASAFHGTDSTSRQKEIIALRIIGDCYIAKGDYVAALDSYKKSFRFGDEHDGVYFNAPSLAALGTYCLKTNDPEQAIMYYKKLRDVRERQGERFTQAMATAMLGNAYQAKGDVASARDQYDQATVLFELLGETRYAAYIKRVKSGNKVADLDFSRPRQHISRQDSSPTRPTLPFQ